MEKRSGVIMSMTKNYYVVAGYDLTGNETDKFSNGSTYKKEKSIYAINVRARFNFLTVR